MTKSTDQDVILDTCILNYLNNQYASFELEKYLSELTKRNFVFSLSEISMAELLRNIPVSKDQKANEILKGFTQHPVKTGYLKSSAFLSTAYNQIGMDIKEENKIKAHTKDISLADLIIASTAIINGSMILTADVNDFPRPFFRVVEQKRIIYEKNNKEVMLFLQLLSPNYDLLLFLIKRRDLAIRKEREKKRKKAQPSR